MTDILLIRVNCPDQAVALHIGESVVRAKLAACANVEGPADSIYWWDGELQREEEWVLVLKAPADNWADIESRVIDLHPQDTPAILAIPCVQANARYADWLKAASGR